MLKLTKTVTKINRKEYYGVKSSACRSYSALKIVNFLNFVYTFPVFSGCSLINPLRNKCGW